MMIAARRGKVICARLNRRRIAATSLHMAIASKGEHLSMDPVGPVKVPAPRGLDSMMAYGDK
jgi:hypothetical protein